MFPPSILKNVKDKGKVRL